MIIHGFMANQIMQCLGTSRVVLQGGTTGPPLEPTDLSRALMYPVIELTFAGKGHGD